MTDIQLTELITEGLTLSKEVEDMEASQVEFNEERYKYAMARMDMIQKEIQKYHEQMNKCKKRWSQNRLFFIKKTRAEAVCKTACIYWSLLHKCKCVTFGKSNKTLRGFGGIIIVCAYNERQVVTP